MALSAPVSQTQIVPLWKIVSWTILFQLAWNWGALLPVMRNGELPGPDDFLRLHQVMNWMNGQGWYDLKLYRMFPPAGGDIHWSRIVDVPIAGLIWFFDNFTTPQTAARLASITWPTVLMVATVLVLVAICDRLIKNYNRLLVVLFSVLSVSSIAQFVPGRLDHHNVQILLLTLVMLGLVMRPSRWADILIGTSIALSISIGLDSAMLFIPILAFLGFEWAIGRDEKGTSLAWIGGSIAIASLGLYAINLPPSQWLDVRCDANSAVFLAALILVAAAFLSLAHASKWLPVTGKRAVISRLSLGILAAACAMVILAWAFPHCANGPLSALSGELNTRWLGNIQEAMSIQEVLDHQPAKWLSTIAYLTIMAGIASFVMIKHAKQKPNLIPLFAILIISVLGIFYQTRIQRTGIYAAIPFCVIFAVMSWHWLQNRFGGSSPMAMISQTLVVVTLTSASWLYAGDFLLPAAKSGEAGDAVQKTADGAEDARRRNNGACFSKNDFATLSVLEPGLVMIDLDTAMPVLVHSAHSVVGGNYHRNGQAILAVLDFFGTDTQTALSVMNKTGAAYVALCKANHRRWGADPAGGSLTARILRNDLPDWLEWVSQPTARLMVLRVVSG